jgi:acetyltransferase-like isoleucine patch superfamily enzyme
MSDPSLQDLLDKLASGERIPYGDPIFRLLDACAAEDQKATAEINTGYHDQAELRTLMGRLIGKEMPEKFMLFPPIYADFGRNISLGEGVFINSGCCFQDQGGVRIGDGCQIGHQVVFATIDHGIDPDRRHDVMASEIVLERNVWVGSHATILRGVTIGHDSIIAAGAVVTRDVPPMTVVAGVPARPVKSIRRSA